MSDRDTRPDLDAAALPDGSIVANPRAAWIATTLTGGNRRWLSTDRDVRTDGDIADMFSPEWGDHRATVLRVGVEGANRG